MALIKERSLGTEFTNSDGGRFCIRECDDDINCIEINIDSGEYFWCKKSDIGIIINVLKEISEQ